MSIGDSEQYLFGELAGRGGLAGQEIEGQGGAGDRGRGAALALCLLPRKAAPPGKLSESVLLRISNGHGL